MEGNLVAITQSLLIEWRKERVAVECVREDEERGFDALTRQDVVQRGGKCGAGVRCAEQKVLITFPRRM